MSSHGSLESRLDRIEAREQMAAVMAEYLYQVDRVRDRAVLESLFTEDAVWEPKGNHAELSPVEGRQQIVDMLVNLPESFSMTAHFVTNAVITVNDDATAGSGRWHALELIGTRAPASELVEVAWYENDFVNDEGTWRLSRVRYEDALVFPYREGWRDVRFISLFTGERVPHDG